MKQSSYDLLVRGVQEFREIAHTQIPSLGKVLGNQLDLLQKELEGTVYGDKIDDSLKALQAEEIIRQFIRSNRSHLIEMVAQHNPYLERGALTQLINNPVFFKVLHEERGLSEAFEAEYKAVIRRFEDLGTPYLAHPELSLKRLVEVSKNSYHLYRGIPCGGPRAKRLIPVEKIFDLDLEENYYSYKGRPYAFLLLGPCKLCCVYDMWSPRLHIHADSTNTHPSKWETYKIPRSGGWVLRDGILVEALQRAMSKNLSTPLPPENEEVRAASFTKTQLHCQKDLEYLDHVRSKLTVMTQASYVHPTMIDTTLAVPVTEDGIYCDIASDFVSGLVEIVISSTVPDEDSRASMETFSKLLPYAVVVTPGAAVPLCEFIQYARDKETVVWMSKHMDLSDTDE